MDRALLIPELIVSNIIVVILIAYIDLFFNTPSSEGGQTRYPCRWSCAWSFLRDLVRHEEHLHISTSMYFLFRFSILVKFFVWNLKSL